MALSGTNGKVQFDTNVVGDISEWSLDISANTIKANKFGDVWQEQVIGLRSWSGKFSGNWNMNDPQQSAAQNALIAGAPVNLRLYVDTTHYYSGTAWIKSISPKAGVDDKVSADFSFDGDGPLSYT